MDAMLQKVADFYEDEVDAATKDMLALLEPVLIAFLGLAVGDLVSLYMPLSACDCQIWPAKQVTSWAGQLAVEN